MKYLKELRGELDQIDQQLVKLFEERMDVCRQVAEFKIQSATKVLDRKREQEKLEAVKALAQNEYNKQSV